MKKEWLWGPGRIDPEHKELTKHAYPERLTLISYLEKLLQNLKPEGLFSRDVHHWPHYR